MNPVAMTIINPLSEYWSSQGLNQPPPVFKSSTHLAECFQFGQAYDSVHRGMCADTLFSFNSLPNNNFLDWSKLKAFAGDKLKVLKISFFVFDRVENTMGKGENPDYQRFLLFWLPAFFSFSLTIFNPFSNKPWFLHVCSTSLLKTLWKKDKLLVRSNLSFSYSVFYPFGELSAIFIKSDIIV